MSLNSFNKLSSLKWGVKVIQGDIRSYLWFYVLQENVNFENFIKFKLNKNHAHLLVTNDDDLQIFIVIDNEVKSKQTATSMVCFLILGCITFLI